MSVLIEGMEMPKKGSWVTLRVFPDGQCVLHSWCGYDEIKFEFMEHLTAVPVPPHGRLIDADEMFDEFVAEGQRSKRYKLGEKWELNGEEIRSVISRLPTVIPANEEG